MELVHSAVDRGMGLDIESQNANYSILVSCLSVLVYLKVFLTRLLMSAAVNTPCHDHLISTVQGQDKVGT